MQFIIFPHYGIMSWSVRVSFFPYCCQFHQHFMSSFCADILSLRNNKAKLLIEKSCKKHFCTKKTACRMLLKLTPAFRIPLIAFRTAVRPRAGRPTWSLPPTNKSISMMTNPKSISVFLIEKNITRLKTV